MSAQRCSDVAVETDDRSAPVLEDGVAVEHEFARARRNSLDQIRDGFANLEVGRRCRRRRLSLAVVLSRRRLLPSSSVIVAARVGSGARRRAALARRRRSRTAPPLSLAGEINR